MINTFEGYMHDHPELKLVSKCPQKELLLWAHKKKYITLRTVEGHKVYTEFQLEVALIWAEKDDSSKSSLKTWKLMVKHFNKPNDWQLYETYKTEADAVAMGHMLLEDNKSGCIEFDIVEE